MSLSVYSTNTLYFTEIQIKLILKWTLYHNTTLLISRCFASVQLSDDYCYLVLNLFNVFHIAQL